MYRKTRVEVNGKNIRKNIRSFKQFFGNKTGLIAVVKANAYGHDSVIVSKIAEEENVSFLGVATLEEAMFLREKNIKKKIIVLGHVHPEYANIAAKNNITLTVFKKDWLKKASRVLDKENIVSIHIKCDTGMNRLGIQWSEKEEIDSFIKELKNYKNISPEGLFTHFATSDEIENDFVFLQLERFKEMINIFNKEEIDFLYTHCGNSAFSLRFPGEPFNLTRIGISMYGLTPSKEMRNTLPFKLYEAFSLKSELTNVKKIKAGETVGYGQTYTAKKDTYIGTVPIGYADGISKKYKTGSVLVNGAYSPIIGSICMDQLMIEVTSKEKEGNEVVLIGRDKEHIITVDDVAKELDTINYEIVCMIQNRVPRVIRN